MKKMRVVIGLLLVALLLGAVGCAASQEEGPVLSLPAPAPAPASPPSEGSSDSKGGNYGVPTAPGVGVPEAPAQYDGDEQSFSGDRMIVRTGNISLVVSDVVSAIDEIAGMAGSFDGYVISSNSWRDGDRLAGTISIRVPAESFDNALATLRGLAVEVLQESTSAVDVTEEYVDLDARLTNLEASEAQLLELMKQAGSVEEILEVQRELAKTRGEIEQIKARMQYLEQTSSTSLITVSLQQAALDVNFTASIRRVKEGQEVYFFPEIAGGISPYTYEWDFGDGETSTEVSPSHVYRSEGSFNVSLKVTDDRGNTDSMLRNNYIDVIPGWSAGGIARSAWNGLASFGRVLANILIWLGIFSPVWIVILLVLYFAWWRRKKRS